MTHYTARRLPVHRGPAAWSALLGAAPAPTPLTRDCTADIAIIGAGFAGLAAARRLHLKDPTLRIPVLDAGRIAEGAAGRNSGFMIDIPHELNSADYKGAGDDRAMIGLNRKAQGFAAEAVDDYGIPPDYFDRAGKINGAVGDAAHHHNETLAQHLTSLNEPSEMLDAQQMHAATGSRYYRSGLFTPGTAMLQPAGFVRGLAAGLVRDGVTLFENTPAQGFDRHGPDWVIATPNGKLTAQKVILTVNGHLESFGIASNRLMQLFLFATMTPELTADQITALGGQSRWGVTPSDPMGTTVRRIDGGQGGHRIVTRTCAVLRPDMTTKPRDLHRAAATMQQKFDLRLPQLAGMKMEHAWAGHLCLSMNGVSVTRQIDEGLFSACVQNGLGTARGVLTGIAAADMALDQQTDIRNHFTAEAEPTGLPTQPVRSWGANAVLRWREWEARAE